MNTDPEAGVVKGTDPASTPYTDAFKDAPPYAAFKGGDSPHHTGESCSEQGCHGTKAFALLIGGTIYKDYKGTIVAPGVEVRVADSNGHAVSTHSAPNGSFYIKSSASNGVAFPAFVGVRDATTTRPMITPLTGAMGSCSAATCHVVGGSPNNGAYYPVHVP